MQESIKIYFIFIWNSTCFERHTAYHQEPKPALASSGFAYVEDVGRVVGGPFTYAKPEAASAV
jgi:hypothetical protein